MEEEERGVGQRWNEQGRSTLGGAGSRLWTGSVRMRMSVSHCAKRPRRLNQCESWVFGDAWSQAPQAIVTLK